MGVENGTRNGTGHHFSGQRNPAETLPDSGEELVPDTDTGEMVPNTYFPHTGNGTGHLFAV